MCVRTQVGVMHELHESRTLTLEADVLCLFLAVSGSCYSGRQMLVCSVLSTPHHHHQTTYEGSFGRIMFIPPVHLQQLENVLADFSLICHLYVTSPLHILHTYFNLPPLLYHSPATLLKGRFHTWVKFCPLGNVMAFYCNVSPQTQALFIVPGFKQGFVIKSFCKGYR